MSKNQILERDNKEEISKESIPQEESQDVNTIKTKRKTVIIASIIVIILLSIFIFSIIFNLINKNNDKILKGISINNINVSGMTKDDAKQEMEYRVSKILNKPIMLKYGEYEACIDTKQIEASFNIDEVINKAYLIGKDNNIFTNYYNIFNLKFTEKKFNLELSINYELLNKLVEDISGDLPNRVEQSSYYIENNNLIITKGKEGVAVNSEELKNIIINKINSLEESSDYIEIPVKTILPDSIDIEKIYKEIYKEPKDAYISKNPFEIHSHIDGIDLGISIDEAKEILKEDKEEYKIPLKITKPSKTIDMLGEEAFPDRLATYSTTYDSSNTNRSTNLRLSASKINGVVLMPGEEFSYNKTLGQRTAAAGYKPAASYVSGKVVNEYGGGICQTSSTLYNTVLLANLDVTSRTSHYYASSYVPISRDATVSWGTLDFKFKNNRKNPIKIRASASNGVVKVDILGVKQDDDYEVELSSKVVSTIKYSTQYEQSASLEEGKEKITQNGVNGCIGEAYKILKKNGKVVSKTLISRDTYRAKPKIVLKGTKKVNKKNNNNNNNNSSNTNNSTSVKIENVPNNTVNKNNTTKQDNNSNTNN